jgi:hypothetical protein
VESAGFGYDLSKREGLEFKLTAAATLTQESNYITDAKAKMTYAGARLAYNYKHKVSDTTTLTHTLMFDQPFSPADNFRIDTQGGVEVAMTRSGTLALKASARLLYDNLPALQELTLVLPGGAPTTIKVAEPLKKLDAQFLVSLVLNLSRKAAAGQ